MLGLFQVIVIFPLVKTESIPFFRNKKKSTLQILFHPHLQLFLNKPVSPFSIGLSDKLYYIHNIWKKMIM